MLLSSKNNGKDKDKDIIFTTFFFHDHKNVDLLNSIIFYIIEIKYNRYGYHKIMITKICGKKISIFNIFSPSVQNFQKNFIFSDIAKSFV